MRQWLKSQLKFVEQIEDHPEPDQQHFDQLRSIVAEAGRRAAQAGLPDCLSSCSIRPGPISPAIARRVLTECLAGCADEMLTIDEVSTMFKVDVRTIRRRVTTGDFPEPVRIGRSVRWKRSDLEGLW
jgi:predicted DNA-binding transcriptional regulator AlpA